MRVIVTISILSIGIASIVSVAAALRAYDALPRNQVVAATTQTEGGALEINPILPGGTLFASEALSGGAPSGRVIHRFFDVRNPYLWAVVGAWWAGALGGFIFDHVVRRRKR